MKKNIKIIDELKNYINCSEIELIDIANKLLADILKIEKKILTRINLIESGKEIDLITKEDDYDILPYIRSLILVTVVLKHVENDRKLECGKDELLYLLHKYKYICCDEDYHRYDILEELVEYINGKRFKEVMDNDFAS